MGLVQDWITLELSIRIHVTKDLSDVPEHAKRKLRVVRRFLFAMITLAFVACSISIIAEGPIKIDPSSDRDCLGSTIIGYFFML